MGVGGHELRDEKQEHGLREKSGHSQVNLSIVARRQVEREKRGSNDDDRRQVQVGDIVTGYSPQSQREDDLCNTHIQSQRGDDLCNRRIQKQREDDPCNTHIQTARVK